MNETLKPFDLSHYGKVKFTNVVGDPLTADVIGIGKCHGRPGITKELQEIVEQSLLEANTILQSVLRPGDILLLEGVPHYMRLPLFIAKNLYPQIYIPNGVRIYGMDSSGEYRKTRKMIRNLGLNKDLSPIEVEAQYKEIVDSDIERRNDSFLGQIARLKKRNPTSRIVFDCGVNHINQRLGQRLQDTGQTYSLIKTNEAIDFQDHYLPAIFNQPTG